MIYVTRLDRESVKNADSYQAWVNILKAGDAVVLQEFYPPYQHSVDFPFERWLFTSGTVHKNGSGWLFRPLFGSNSVPIKENGKRCYFNSDQDSGNVFPNRIIPPHSSLSLSADLKGFSQWGHYPVYEPLFLGAYRHCLLVKRSKDLMFASYKLKEMFPYSYSFDVEQGTLFNVFAGEWLEEQCSHIDCTYLYGQYIRA